MYSGTSPFLRVKFWKKELVGRGEERRDGEKKVEGSGTTEDSVLGKTKGRIFWDMAGGGGGDGGGNGWGGGGGGGVW